MTNRNDYTSGKCDKCEFISFFDEENIDGFICWNCDYKVVFNTLYVNGSPRETYSTKSYYNYRLATGKRTP